MSDIMKDMKVFSNLFTKQKIRPIGRRLGVRSYMTEAEVQEGMAATIQKAALDFLSDKFRGYPKHMVTRELENRADEFYEKWVFFAKTFHGLNSTYDHQIGWEMIMGLEGLDSLVGFPDRGAHHQ